MAVWTTEDLPERDQFSYWREVICDVYVALNPIRPAAGGFIGNVTAHPLSTINVTTISSTRQQIFRGRPEISKMPLEVYFLNLQVKGQCRMSQGPRDALLRPGEFSIVDSTKPYLCDYCSDDWEQHSFRIPQYLLRPALLDPDRSTAVRVASDGGIGTVAVDYLMSIAKNADALSAPAAAKLGASMVEVVALSLGATGGAQEAGKGTARQALCSSLINHIDANSADPDLSPVKVAAHFGVSTRYLHKVLEEGGQSFGRTLLQRRLERCARDFAVSTGSISEVALRWGFNDLSHFSRTFRQRFGKTPREYRHEQARDQAAALPAA